MSRLLIILLLGVAACVRVQSGATPTSPPINNNEIAASPMPVQTAAPVATLVQPTLDADPITTPQLPREYVVQAGDSMYGIALAYGVPLELLLDVNTDLSDPNILNVGQVIKLPDLPGMTSSAFKIIPANRLVRGPGSAAFDVDDFIAQQPGYVRSVTDIVDGHLLSASEIFERVALEFSVDTRLLLALVELKSRWLSNPEPDEEAQLHPLGAGPSPLGFERDGLYRQLTWAADQLNAGYYGHKYRNLRAIAFEEGYQLRFAEGLNDATVAVQYMLSQFNSYGIWQAQIGSEGLYQVYVDYFGDPFVDALEPLIPEGLVQPEMLLPFAQDEIWYFTGGPHGGWGSGSAWAAIDFAPPDDLTEVDSACYVSETWARAVASGLIARIGTGVVVLDLDGDGDESTGWTVLYLHLVLDKELSVGMVVNAGDALGRPSCEGGVSNGTHVHLARRYNGEWVPAHCENCPDTATIPRFVLGEWSVLGLPGQEYQGFLLRGAEQRIAEQGRLEQDNLVSW